MQTTGTDLGSELTNEVTGMGYEMLGMDRWYSGHIPMIRVYIDRDGGISLSDCEQVAVQLQGVLRLHYPNVDPRLEVSSPGVDRPLFTIAHFARFIGHCAKVSLSVKREDGRRRLSGRIVSVEGDDICLQVDEEQITLRLDMIEKARLVPEWKKIGK